MAEVQGHFAVEEVSPEILDLQEQGIEESEEPPGEEHQKDSKGACA